MNELLGYLDNMLIVPFPGDLLQFPTFLIHDIMN